MGSKIPDSGRHVPQTVGAGHPVLWLSAGGAQDRQEPEALPSDEAASKLVAPIKNATPNRVALVLQSDIPD